MYCEKRWVFGLPQCYPHCTARCITDTFSHHTGILSKQRVYVLSWKLSFGMIKPWVHLASSKKKISANYVLVQATIFYPVPLYKAAAVAAETDMCVMPVDELTHLWRNFLARQIELTVKLCSLRRMRGVPCSEFRSARRCWNSPTRAPGSWGSRWPRQHEHHLCFRVHQRLLGNSSPSP